jgi:hypothetical protein
MGDIGSSIHHGKEKLYREQDRGKAPPTKCIRAFCHAKTHLEVHAHVFEEAALKQQHRAATANVQRAVFGKHRVGDGRLRLLTDVDRAQSA